MLDAWLFLTRLNVDLMTVGANSLGDAWKLLTFGQHPPGWASAPLNRDLRTLGLDRMPQSPTVLRSAYRRAAKTAHPDTGGDANAFRAVAEAFGRLERSRA